MRAGSLSFLVLVPAVGLSAMATPAAADDDGSAPVAMQRTWTKTWGYPGPVYDLALRLARSGDFADAALLLKALKRPDDPRVLNMLGYTTRKLGRAGEAVPYYEKALGLAPDFTPAREYLGEAWLQLDQPDKARAQLAEIEKLCGTSCAAYRTLARAIAAHESGTVPASTPAW